MIQIDLVLIGFLAGTTTAFLLIVLLTSLRKPYDGIHYEIHKPHVDSTTWQTAAFGPKVAKEEDYVDPVAKKLSERDDIINHDGVGIVYRPTNEELVKMQEPQIERESKEAVAELLRQEVAPEV